MTTFTTCSSSAQYSLPQKFTGKERDETGLDYFGARYYSGALGRFTSTDPLLNSGRPPEPQSWNRYTYALNNPLRYVDPDGLWEWSVSCDERKDSTCHENREWFRNGIKKVNEALAKADPKSQEYKDLKRVSELYGEEDKATGIKVAFSNKIPAADSTSDTATFNVNALTDNANAWSKATGGVVDPSVEFAAQIAHEGSNVFDRIGRTTKEDYPRIFEDEINAYRTQSDVNYLFNTRSIYGLWDPSWARIDKVTAAKNRNTAIRDWAEKSTDRTFGIERK